MTAWPLALALWMGWGATALGLSLASRAGWLRSAGITGLGLGLWAIPVLALALVESTQGPVGWPPLALLLALGAYSLAYLRTPKRLLGQPVVPLDAPELEAGLAAIALAQGQRPLVFLQISTGASLGAHAWAANIAAPTVVIADGVLHRLSLEQQLALGAHEIAHHRSGSLWWLMAGSPLGVALGVLATIWLPVGAAMGVGLVLSVLISRVWVSRLTELHCDRLGARYTSASALRAAFERLHALHPVDVERPLGLLAYALSTHPAMPVRLRALGQPKAPVTGTESTAARHRRAAWLAQLGLVLALAAMALGGLSFVWFLGLAMTPRALLLLSARREIGQQRRRMPTGWEPVALGLSAGAVLALAVPVLDGLLSDTSLMPWLPLLLVAEVLAGVLGYRHNRRRKLAKRIREPLMSGMGDVVWSFWEGEADTLLKHPPIAHDVLAVGVFLDKPGASKALLALAPRFPQAALTLSGLSQGSDPGLSLRAAQVFCGLLPQDYAGALAAGRAHLAAGELDSAQEELERGRALKQAPELQILEAAIALARGELSLASQALERGESALPGDPWLGVVRADHLLRSGEHQAARTQLERTQTALAALPVHGHGVEVERLLAALSAELGPAAG